MEAIRLDKVKKGEFFTRKPNEYPGEAQVLIKGEYVRGTKKYISIHWNDINRWIMLKGDTIVYVGFTF